ncbi:MULTISPECIES: DUF6116 family protein [unclassified Luteimonas]
MPNPILAPLFRWLGRLSYPKLFLVAVALFTVNLFIPDPLPFVDEVLLGIGAMMIARRKRKPEPLGDQVIDGEARRG